MLGAMRVTMALWFLAVISWCSSNSGALGPDATPPTSVHDLLAVPCDQAWSTGGVAPKFCERACATPPVMTPCARKMPCYDHPSCNVVQSDPAVPGSCSGTFVATDETGMHAGCCYEHASSANNPAIYFAECVK